MSATIWVLIGLIAIFFEVLMPVGFAFFILGVAAIIVGAATAVGALATLEWQLISAAVIATVVWLTSVRSLRSLFGRGEQAVVSGGNAEGKQVRVLEDLQPGQWGQGELWGSPWRVRNIGSAVIPKGSECVVVQTEGNGLLIRG